MTPLDWSFPGVFALSQFEQEALALSLRVASIAVLSSLPIGIAIAFILARFRFPGHGLLNAVVHMPLVLPPVVVGYLLLVLLGRNGPLGSLIEDVFGVRLAFSTSGAVIACAVVSFPLLVRSVRLSIEAIDTRLESAARTLGANETRVFLTITLPMMVPGILTGSLLAFARALSEFGATITFAANVPGETQTLPLALYTVLQSPGGDAAAFRLCVLSILLAVAAIATSEWLSQRLIASRNGEAVA